MTTAPCPHRRVTNSRCDDCGECVHDVVLNGACIHCGSTDISVTVAPTEPVVPAKRLVRRRKPEA